MRTAMRKLLLSSLITVTAISGIPAVAHTPYQQIRFADTSLEAGAVSCAQLTQLRQPDLRIERATSVAANSTWDLASLMTTRVEPGFCRVEGSIEGTIDFEVWLPLKEDWNGRMLGTGNGGFAGTILTNGLAHGVQRGFATSSTNTGHHDWEQNWAVGNTRAQENYAHRAQHLTAVNAKVIIEAFYGRAPDHNYFMGCSGGGRQAMVEAQRYPADYDGVVAGAAGQSMVGISARWVESALIGSRWPGERLSQLQWASIEQAAIAQCDADDGVSDGIIGDPRSCSFDIADTPGLTPGQIATARHTLGPITGEDGRVLFAGYRPGVTFPAMDDPGIPGAFFQGWLYNDLGWDLAQFNAARDVPAAEDAVPFLSIRNPDMYAFQRRGGKLINYHGWSDGIVPADSTITFHQSVRRTLGDELTDSFYRLYMVPGMDHCSGGYGADFFGQTWLAETPEERTPENDVLLAIIDWVEQGNAPGTLRATRIEDQQVTYSRPLCPYPASPVYSGSGDPALAESFTCEQP